jgi:hypothetical protein
MDITRSGTVVINSDVTSLLNEYIADGRLLGNSSVSNVLVVVTTNEITGVTNTTITALAPALPSYLNRHVSVATTQIVADGYVVGTISNTYVRGKMPEYVLAQDPEAGNQQTPAGSTINLTIQEPAAAEQTAITWTGVSSTDWNDPSNWDLTDVPLRETQNYRVNVTSAAGECMLNSAVGAARLFLDGGNLKLASGADLYAGKQPTNTYWTCVGYDLNSVLTVESGARLETADRMIFANRGSGESVINLNGGEIKISGQLQLGSEDYMGNAWGVMNISTGGVLRAETMRYFNGFSNGVNSVINMYDGTIILSGNRTNDVIGYLASGGIVIHSPDSSLTYTNNQTILQTIQDPPVGFGTWASQWGVNIGDATNDYDGDGFNNLYEYAFDGNPTNSASIGTAQVLTNAGGVLTFTFRVRNDDPNLAYSVETTDDLVSGTWANVGYTTPTSSIPDGDYNIVTHTIPVTDARKFVRVKIVQTP